MRHPDGRILNVRKRGTTKLMLPGGKPDPGEDARDTAIREFQEELGIALSSVRLRSVGVFTTRAANEPGHELVASVFEHPYVNEMTTVSPLAEIEHLEWIDPVDHRDDMAPLNTEHVFPVLLNGHRPKPLRVAVFTGSTPGTEPHFAEAAAHLARALAAAGVGVVFGGGRVGLMGIVAESALARGGEVIGVMPKGLVSSELAHQDLARNEIVDDMHARKHRMASLTDAFVALPGGLGTLEELFEVWTWLNLGIHEKPVALYNVDGYWNPLLDMVDAMVDRGFVAPRHRDALIVADSPEDLFEQLSYWEAPARKWNQGL